MTTKTYTLTVTENQARIIAHAVDTRATPV